jgi:hypothetical protein
VRTQLYCPENARRSLVLGTSVNGIDYLEVLPSKRTLLVHCFWTAQGLDEGNVLIEGGVRVSNVRVEWALPADDVVTGGPAGDRLPPEDQAVIDGPIARGSALVVRTDSSGDFSTYVFRLVESHASPETPPPGFDQLLSDVAFSFKVDCPSEFDCRPEDTCEEPTWPSPQIDYLAKDYASFRRLLFDRLAIVMPNWRERNAADVLVAIVELLAYAGDYLSYYQDAAATEAYLGTARRRTSVRRHARLVDYAMHEGASARAWVSIAVGPGADGADVPERTQVLTGELGAPPRIEPADVPEAVSKGALVFETVDPIRLRAARNRVRFYTWGDPRCCLPKGATKATLVGPQQRLQLRAGDVLVFEELVGPESRHPEDADRTHRHAVRLTKVTAGFDETPPERPPIVEVEWHAEDALPFPLCLWELDDGPTSIAHGNVVLADHGRTLPPEDLGRPREGRRFRPQLDRLGLSFVQRPDERESRKWSATRLGSVDVRKAEADMHVVIDGERWEPLRELLNADRFATSFVAEMEEDGRATLRFGDGVLGREPTGEQFSAVYRVGSGSAGNVGVDTLTRLATQLHDIVSVTNPLPGQGGTDPEPLEQVRLYAPQAFRRQQRAVTPADYAMFAERHPEVQRAGATRRWTGSWYTMFVTVDRRGGLAVTPEFEDELRAFLDPFRLAGYDLEIDEPQFVPLDLALTVCVKPGYVRSNVKEALLEVFGTRDLRSGQRGLFHPDKFTFAQPVYLSRVIAAAMSVPGVDWVQVTRFQRWREPARNELDKGRIDFGRLEIARLDNDPNRPENGKLELVLKGGL